MSFDALRPRLTRGRPLVLDSDTGAAFRARGSALDTPGSLGLMLRERPAEIRAHYAAEVESRVDVLSALTADTTPRALAEVGMQHRAAALTSLAVELAHEAAAASRPVAVAGVLGSDMVTPIAADRLREELAEHAERLAVAGCELVIARGQGSQVGLMAAVAAAAQNDLFTFAVVECDAQGRVVTGSTLSELVFAVADAGAAAVLIEVPSVDAGLECLSALAALAPGASPIPGVLLGSSAESVRGFPDREGVAANWVDRAMELGTAGARVIGGGAGTTESHTRALAAALGVLHPSSPPRPKRPPEGPP